MVQTWETDPLGHAAGQGRVNNGPRRTNREGLAPMSRHITWNTYAEPHAFKGVTSQVNKEERGSTAVWGSQSSSFGGQASAWRRELEALGDIFFGVII